MKGNKYDSKEIYVRRTVRVRFMVNAGQRHIHNTPWQTAKDTTKAPFFQEI